MAVIQSTSAYKLKASITPVAADRHRLLITSLVPCARRPEEETRRQVVLTSGELLALRNVLDQALEVAV